MQRVAAEANAEMSLIMLNASCETRVEIYKEKEGRLQSLFQRATRPKTESIEEMELR